MYTKARIYTDKLIQSASPNTAAVLNNATYAVMLSKYCFIYAPLPDITAFKPNAAKSALNTLLKMYLPPQDLLWQQNLG